MTFLYYIMINYDWQTDICVPIRGLRFLFIPCALMYMFHLSKSGWKVVGEVKKEGKSRNFQPKVGKSRNFSVFKVGKIRNFYYNFSSFNLSINSKVFPFELFNYHNCLQLSIELYKINFIDVLLNVASIYCWVINHFPSRTFNKLLSF